MFGSWWILVCSNTNFNSLNASFTACLRSVFGFSKLVPSSEVHTFAGVPTLIDYLPFWLGSRVVALNLHGHVDIFTKERNLRTSILSNLPPMSYNLRGTTLASRELNAMNNNYFPDSVREWYCKCKEVISKGEDLIRSNGPTGYKLGLKRSFVPVLLDKNTVVGPGVKQLNEFYYNLRTS